MPDSKLNRGEPDRSKINMHEDYEVKYWTKHLGVTKDQLQQTVDKVGNSVSAVKKELAAQGHAAR
jgi:3-oxoacyl-[acyl-carrier-protein] synthase III